MPRYVCHAVLLGLAALLSSASVALGQSRNLFTPPTPLPRTQDQQQNDAPPPGNFIPPPEAYVGSASGFLARYADARYNTGGSAWGWPGSRVPFAGSRVGDALQGLSSYTQAQGNYQIQIQEARLGREQARQANIDTARQRLQWEIEYESFRPTASRLAAQTERTNLDWARNHARSTEIWSGRTLNVLLQSILRSPNATNGPHIPLPEKQLAGLNLTDGTTRANLSLAKDHGRITWPEGLQGEAFDTLRDSFEKAFAGAVKSVERGEQPDVRLLRTLRADSAEMERKVRDQVRVLTPSQYIGAKRLLNQLRDTIRGFSDPRVIKSAGSDWRRNVRTVGDLVSHLKSNGLQFGPAAAPGDHAAYVAVYFSLRDYEAALWLY